MYRNDLVFVQDLYYCIYLFINSGCEREDTQERELNHFISQEHPGEKTVLVVGKPQRSIQETPIGTENPFSGPGKKGKERYPYANPTALANNKLTKKPH